MPPNAGHADCSFPDESGGGAMGSDPNESRQRSLLDFSGPVGPLSKLGPTIKCEHKYVGPRSWRPELEAFVAGKWEWSLLLGKYIITFPTKEYSL